VYSAPPIEDITKNVYAHKENVNECYTFKTYSVDCGKAKNEPIKKVKKEEFKTREFGNHFMRT
jgi:hypothetical protein